MPSFISKLVLQSFFLPTDTLAQQSFPEIGMNTFKNVMLGDTKNNNETNVQIYTNVLICRDYEVETGNLNN